MGETPKTNKRGFMTGLLERFSYGTYFVGQNIFYILLMLYLTVFFTDIGIPAATVAILALIVKVWDAVNDPIFGGMVDRIKFKKGKFLPWLRISLVFIPLATIALFAIPSGISLTAKVIWAAVAYILWDTAYTICDVPIFGIITTMTNNLQERTSLVSIGRVAALLAAVIVMVIVPQVRTAIGGWLPTVVVLSIIALVTMAPICFTAKERIEAVNADQEVGLKDMFKFLGKNKYMLIYYLSVLISGAANISTTTMMYLARYCLGDESKQTTIMLAIMGPTLLAAVIVPQLIKKIDKYYMYLYASIATGVFAVAAYFVGYKDFTSFLIMSAIRGVAMGVTSVLMFMFTPDCADYGLYRSGISAPGISFSIQTFTAKLNGALATSIGAAAIAAIGFIEGEGAQQLAGFPDKFWAVYSLIPAVGAILSVIPLFFYKLRDKDVQVMSKCNAGEITRDEAEALLDGRYTN